MVDGKLYCIFRQTYSEQAETIKDRTIAYRWDLAREAGARPNAVTKRLLRLRESLRRELEEEGVAL